MEREFIKGDIEWHFFKDYYLFIQKFAIIDSESKETNDKWWYDFVKAASKLDKYRNNDFFLSLIRIFVQQKEEEQRKINQKFLLA